MTLSSPSFWAAFTRASMPPRSSAEVAVAASELPPPPEPPSSELPRAVRVSPAVTTATAVTRVLRRTCPPGGGTGPSVIRLATGAGVAIVADRSRRGAVTAHECVVNAALSPSAPGELRLPRAVLEEGPHAGLLVLGVEELGEQARLQGQAVVQRAVEAAVDRPLGGGEGERRAGGELAGHGHRGRVHLVVGDDGVGEPDLQGLLRAHVPAGED